MEISNTMKMIDEIGIIQKEMEAIGKTDLIISQEDKHALCSVYFLEKGKTVSDNSKILKSINRLYKNFNVKCISIGKTVTFYLEVK